MKLSRSLMATCVLLICGLVRAVNHPYYQCDFPREEFQARWAKVFDRIGKDAVTVLQGAPQVSPSLTTGA
jgi:hypothetical protein